MTFEIAFEDTCMCIKNDRLCYSIAATRVIKKLTDLGNDIVIRTEYESLAKVWATGNNLRILGYNFDYKYIDLSVSNKDLVLSSNYKSGVFDWSKVIDILVNKGILDKEDQVELTYQIDEDLKLLEQ